MQKFELLLVAFALIIGGCNRGDGDYTRTGDTKHRLNDIKLVIEKLKKSDPEHDITTMDDVIAVALKRGYILPSDVEELRNDAWNNPIAIYPHTNQSGVIVSNGQNRKYDDCKKDDICLPY